MNTTFSVIIFGVIAIFLFEYFLTKVLDFIFGEKPNRNYVVLFITLTFFSLFVYVWFEMNKDILVEPPATTIPSGSSDNSPTPTPTTTATVGAIVTTTITPTFISTPINIISTRPIDDMNMVYISGDTFLMGSDEGPANEQPTHNITLNSFWIDQTEVTNKQFSQFINETNHKTIAEEEGTGWIHTERGWEEARGVDWRHPNGGDSDLGGLFQHPVVFVTWYDAKAYCEWVGGRLPFEAEWEYAARGQNSLIFPWSNEFDGGRLNFCDVNCPFDQKDYSVDDGYALAAPVGSFPKGNSWAGVSDMAGNVWEWVNDWYDEDYYANSPAHNPSGSLTGDTKLLRGGSWVNRINDQRSSYRSHQIPTLRSFDLGFRCAMADK